MATKKVAKVQPAWRGFDLFWDSTRDAYRAIRPPLGVTLDVKPIRGGYHAHVIVCGFVYYAKGKTSGEALDAALALHRARLTEDAATLDRLFGSEGE